MSPKALIRKLFSVVVLPIHIAKLPHFISLKKEEENRGTEVEVGTRLLTIMGRTDST